LVAWAALRLGQRGTTLTTFAATAITIWDWSNGLGIATTKGDLESLLELQSFLCVLAVTGMTLVAITSERQKAEQLARGQAQALVKSIAFLTAAPHLDRFLEHVLRVMIEDLRGSGGVLWLPDHETEALRLHLEYVEGRILTAADTVYPAGINLSRSKKVLCHWTQTVGAKPAFTARAISGSLTLKHAGASTFKVKLLSERYGVQLQIRDNGGKGFNPALQYDGSGLIGMRERARRIGEELAIESSPGGGTEIRVVLRLGQAEALEA
jgi:hypothetical protein